MKNLTVEELIEKLKQMPKDYIPCVCLGEDGDAYGFCDVFDCDDEMAILMLNEEL